MRIDLLAHGFGAVAPWGWALLCIVLAAAIAGVLYFYRRRQHQLRRLLDASIAATERLRLVLGQMPAMVWTVDADLRFASIEGGSFASLGHEPSKMVGVVIYDYFKTSDRNYKPIAGHEDAVRLGKSSTYEIVWVNRTYHVHLDPLRDHQGNIIGAVGAALDISARKQAEEALARSEARLRALLNAIPDVMFRLKGDGTIVEFIDKLAAPTSVVPGGPLTQVFDAEIAQRFIAHACEALRSGETQVFEYATGRNSSSSFFEARIVPCAQDEVLVILRNITMRKRAELDLARREAEMRSLIKAIPDIILQITPDGRLAGCVAGNDDLLLPPDQFLGHKMHDVLPTPVADALLGSVQNALATSEPQVCQYPLEIRGELRWFEARVVFVGNGSDQVLALIRNITDSRHKPTDPATAQSASA